MNRTIKFRGKTTKENKWIYGGISVFDGYVDMFDESDIVNSCETVVPETVGQFTGLTDKNGKEVYENDVNDKGEILKWNVIHNCFGWFTQGGFKRHILSEVYDHKGELTTPHISEAIIGNIHENPELLS